MSPALIHSGPPSLPRARARWMVMAKRTRWTPTGTLRLQPQAVLGGCGPPSHCLDPHVCGMVMLAGSACGTLRGLELASGTTARLAWHAALSSIACRCLQPPSGSDSGRHTNAELASVRSAPEGAVAGWPSPPSLCHDPSRALDEEGAPSHVASAPISVQPRSLAFARFPLWGPHHGI